MGQTSKKRHEEDDARARTVAEQDHLDGGRSSLADSDVDAAEEADQHQREDPRGGGKKSKMAPTKVIIFNC